jgi:uncharacterized membrane protein affecting hemolysin expression
MPSHKYFEELTLAVLTDVDQVQGFSQRQSAEQIQQLSQELYQRIAGTFAQLLDAEMEEVGKRTELHEQMAEVRRASEAADAAEADQAMQQLEEWVRQTLPFYDAFLLKVGLRIRKAFVEGLTKS